ncbi:carotenoid oxygenase [Mycolicibacterium fortuitum]|uniref:Dioxygenase n=1 Tax=Mycolicibacterium fortuitum TaxID=1766 RepID=A0ABD6QCM2_MYCFO|nr:carotenoid oxygenase family protein [Mycolicibacterium fortuitum]OMC33120.1 carotenoid oxygenase [Mycolicibacterium fortuitum]
MGYPIPQITATKGPFRPMRFEATVEECIVSEGEIPKDLAGGFYRCGPTFKRPRVSDNPLPGMDGMVQGIVFENGRADFRNRWVRSPKYLLEEKHGRAMFQLTDGQFGDWRDYGWGRVLRDEYNYGRPQGTYNINVFPFAGEMLATGEQGGPPIALDPITLETKGIVDWSPQLSSGIHEPASYGDNGFCAHPKWDEATGVLYGWSYRAERPYVTMHYVHPDGKVESRDLVDAPYNTVAHDIWLTEDWVVMPFQPFILDTKRIDVGKSVFGWDPSLPIVVALIPRDDIHGQIRWIETDFDPQYIMHTMGANVIDGKLQLDGPIFNRPPFALEQDFAEGDDVALFFSIARSHLGRWNIDLDTGKSTADQLSDRPSELPKVDERFFGKPYTWGYQVGGVVKRGGMSMNSLVITNMRTMQEQHYQLRDGQPAAVLEATFAPRSKEAPEGDGYVIVPVSWWAENRGEYQIFDTYDITKGPICKIELPFALGWTPHGHWMDFR